MASVSFDGDNKHINVLTGISELNIQDDAYSEWKRWIQLSDNAKYDQAFRTVGGDPTAAGQYSPRYFFLMNGWRIRVDGNVTPAVEVAINLYVEEGGSPFILVNGSTVSNLRSDVGIVESELQDILDYAGVIIYDEDDGQAGEQHPTGTAAYPVNNSADLQTLMDLYDINKVLLQSDCTVTQSFENVLWETNTAAEFFNPDGNTMNSCFFYRMTISGDFGYASAGSSIVVQDCSIGDTQGIYGVANNCHLGGDIYIQPDQQLVMSACASAIPGTASPKIYFGEAGKSQGCGLSMRSYSGGLRLLNMDHTDDVATCEYVAGKCHIGVSITDDGNNTDGYVSVRGIAYLNDYSNGTEVDTSAMFETSNTYAGVLHFGHGVGSTAGDSYPVGTSRKPVNNWTDAIAIMSEYHLHNIELHTDAQLTESIQNAEFSSAAGIVYLDLNGQDVNGSRFDAIGVVGDFADSQVVIEDCYIVSAYRFHGLISDCHLGGIIQSSVSGGTAMKNCSTAMDTDDPANAIQIFDMGNGKTNISCHAARGSFRVINMTDSDAYFAIDLDGGVLEINSSCTNGTIDVRGQGTLIDTSNGSTVNSDGFLDSTIHNDQTNKILGMVQSNFHMFNHVYDGDGNLTSASVALYPSAAELSSDSNRIATYGMTAVYTAGVVTDYRMIEV